MPIREIGVAIGLPEPLHSELTAWRERLGDPNAKSIPPHITLLPPTAMDEVMLWNAEEHLRQVAAGEEPFDVHLRGSSTFRPVSPVVFVPLVHGISDCERVESKIRRGPLGRELNFPFHPHVTVAHDVGEQMLDRAFAELATYEGRFRVWGFTMFEQGRDKVWRPQRDFPFGRAGLPGPAEPGDAQPASG
jgi:2'-5' RNA ligase